MKYSEHNVMSNNPHVQSLAALVLLTKKLTLKSYGYRVWLKYRRWWIKEHLKTHDRLYCEYCGKGPLKIQSRNNNNIATLDHVIPISKNGPKFDSSNIVIACSACNGRKGDKDLNKFI